MSGTIYAIAISGTDIYIGGNFATAYNPGPLTVNNISRYSTSNNTFYQLGAGSYGVGGDVRAIAVSGTDVYIGGRFTTANNLSPLTVNYITRYSTDGEGDDEENTFYPLGAGSYGVEGGYNIVDAIAISLTDVYIGGDFTTANNSSQLTVNNITRYSIDGEGDDEENTFYTLGAGSFGVNSSVYAIAISGTDVYIGGGFTTANNLSPLTVNYITRYSTDGEGDDEENTFYPLGAGSYGVNYLVRAIAISGTDVYIGGEFFTANNSSPLSVNYITRYSTSDNTFYPLGEGSNGVNRFVYAIAISGTDVYIGGEFSTANNSSPLSVNYITRYSTSNNTFYPLGAGSYGVDNIVPAIAISGSSLYIGGTFEPTGFQIYAPTVAAYSGSSAQISVLNDSSGDVYLIYRDQNDDLIYRGYDFSESTWQNAVTVHTGTVSSPSLAIDTPSQSLLAFFIEASGVKYKRGASPYSVSDWSSEPTTVYNTGTNTNLNSSLQTASGHQLILWTNGTSNPYSVLSGQMSLDSTPPTVTEGTPVPTPTNDTTPNYTFSTTEAGTITYGGDCSSATTSASSGSNTVTFNTLSAGAHSNCTITVSDAASNPSTPLSVTAFTIDTTSPAAPVINVPTNNQTLNTQTPEISGTAEPLSIVRIYIDNNQASTVVTDSEGVWTDTVSANLTESTHTIKATATDLAQNTSPESDIITITVTLITDSDGDGYTDQQELLDGTDPYDRGSFLQVLETTVCSEWNGFLNMWNIMEHMNKSEQTMQVHATLYNLDGEVRGTEDFTIGAGLQFDLLIHDIEGFEQNSYGKVCSTATSGSPGDLDGRMVYYKPVDQQGSSFEFAFAMPFMNGRTGEQYVPFNNYQPSLSYEDRNNLVANWIQISNLNSSEQSGTLSFYGQSGEELSSTHILLLPEARRDIGAHELGRDIVGLAIWQPDSNTAKFNLKNIRYIYDNSEWRESFQSAFVIDGMIATGELITVPLDTRDSSSVLEIANTKAESETVEVNLYTSEGEQVVETLQISLSAYSSYHLLVHELLSSGQGIATVQGSAPASTIAVAMQYGRTATQSIEYIYGITATQALGQTLAGTYTTFLNQDCRLLLTNPTSTVQTATLNMTSFDAVQELINETVSVPANGLLDYDLCQNSGADKYGVLTVGIEHSNSLFATVLRVGNNNTYRFPTLVRQ